MVKITDLPDLMADLPKDERGYPIPYFVAYDDSGKPDFRYQDHAKKEACRKYHKCFVCGKKLTKKTFWFIAGPIGLNNAVSSDEAMHEECARFSLINCPHLFYEKAERRNTDPKGMPLITQALSKPDTLFLVKSDKVTFVDEMHTKFRVVRTERYGYENNKLIPA